MRRRPRLVVGGTVALAATVAGVVLAVSAGAGTDRCEEFATAATQRWQRSVAAAVDQPADAQRILVIGDSYSVGLGVEQEQSWPSRLPGRVLVDGFSGSGFSADASECGDLSYASRAADRLGPDRGDVGAIDVVVVEGGLNDFDQAPERIEEGVRRLFDVLGEALGDRPVLVVGPPPAPSRSTAVPLVDEQLRQLTEELGGTYLSMLEEEFDYLPDALHLTPDGHAAFGDLVAAAL